MIDHGPGVDTAHHPAKKLLAPGRCLVIAEIAQAHDGSLGTAHAYIDAAADAGADVVKLQTHIAAAESTKDEPWRVRFSPQDQSRYDYWQRMELSEDQWQGLASHAAERGLLFLSTPFSLEAVALLQRIGMAAWKIGSGELTNQPLLEQVAATGDPVLLSSGMATWAELDAAVATVRGLGAPLAIFQCTSAYPCPPEKIGLNLLAELRSRYGCPVGLSDHSGGIAAGLAAVALGAQLLEVHVVFDRRCFGPDVAVSVTIDELQQLSRGVRFLEQALANPVSKDSIAGELDGMRSMFHKSIVAKRALPAGHRLQEQDLGFKKPGHGLPAAAWRQVIGRRLRCAVERDHFLSEHELCCESDPDAAAAEPRLAGEGLSNEQDRRAVPAEKHGKEDRD